MLFTRNSLQMQQYRQLKSKSVVKDIPCKYLSKKVGVAVLKSDKKYFNRKKTTGH